MSIKEDRDYLYLIWKSEKSRKQFIIGELSKNSHYTFCYCQEVSEAEKEGFKPLISFPNLDEIYCSKELFPVFESRLPDKKRKDMHNILKKYEMDEYEPFQLLKRSGARLPIDTLYFVDPIIDTNEQVNRKFYMAGVRHYIGCNGKACDQSLDISVGEQVFLQQEPTNVKDSKAVKVLNSKGDMLGYIPRYYSEKVFEMIQNNRKMKCTVLAVDKNKSCDECIKLTLEVQ